MSLRFIKPKQPVRGASIRGASGVQSTRVSGLGADLRQLMRRVIAIAFGPWVLLIASLCVGAFLVHSGQSYVSGVIDRPVAQVNVEGEFSYVTREQVMDVIAPAIDQNFLQLDLSKIKQDLEKEAWVDVASVGRRWPNQLEVSIVEQKPIARWSDEGFLNQRGELIKTRLGEELMMLPLLEASAHTQAEVMNQYQDLAVLLRSRNLVIGGLKSDKKRAWTVILNNGLEVQVGRDQVMEKMKRFIKVYDRELHLRMAEVERIDVRYSNGVAVDWLETTDNLLTTQLVGQKFSQGVQ